MELRFACNREILLESRHTAVFTKKIERELQCKIHDQKTLTASPANPSHRKCSATKMTTQFGLTSK